MAKLSDSTTGVSSLDWKTRLDAEIVLKRECEWAAFLGITAVLFPTPLLSCSRNSISAYARAVNDMLNLLPEWCTIFIPFSSSATTSEWQAWDSIRQFCHFSPRLQVCLELSDGHLLEQWYAEPVKMVVFPTGLFSHATKSYPPVQLRSDQLFSSFITLCKWFFSTGPPMKAIVSHSGTEPPQSPLSDYVSFLFHHMTLEIASLPSDPDAVMAREYQDTLQTPLQPLAHHLESATYQVFERDKAKYDAYEQAIAQALMHQPTGTYSVFL